MQIVVDIEDSVYHQIKQHGEISEFHKLIIHGTPLPKGHGDLVDTSYFKYYLRDTYIDSIGFNRAMSAMKKLPTIIEADKEQTDGKDNR